MRRVGLGVGLAGLLGCTPPPPPAVPAPLQLHAAASPTVVAQRAAQRLTLAGFTLTTADAAGGIVAASRTTQDAAADSLVVCRWPKGSTADKLKQATVAVTVLATPDTVGSTVVIRTAVHSRIEHWDGPLAQTEGDCQSRGTLERGLAESLTR